MKKKNSKKKISKSDLLELNEERQIFLFDDINQYSVKELAELIVKINLKDDFNEKRYTNYKRSSINFYINSFGGDPYSSLGLYSLMKKSKTIVNTYALGAIMSGGFLIYLGGKERFAYDGSYFMYHEVADIRFGKLQDFKENNEHLRNVQKSYDEVVINETFIKNEKLKSIKKRKIDWYIDINKAKELNIVHKII